MSNPSSDLKWAVLVLTLGVVLGYSGLLFGGAFLSDEDPVTLMDWASRNALTSGWRSDLGLGLPTFVADPGAGHVWSILSLIERVFPWPHLVYPWSIVVLLVLTAFAQYVFLRRLVPTLGLWLLPVALLIVFSPLQHEFYFQRHWITLTLCAPMLLLSMDAYLRRPSWYHFLGLAVIMVLVFALGSLAPVTHAAAATFLFLLALVLRRQVAFGVAMGRFAAAWVGIVIIMALVMAWTLYSMAIEQSTTPYTRDILRTIPTFYNHSLIEWGIFLSKYLHSGYLNNAAMEHGLMLLEPFSWNNVSPLFPIIILIMSFKRSENIWEYVCKTMVWAFFAWQLLCFVAPGASYGLIQQFINAYPLTKFHPFYETLQVGLIGFFILRLRQGEALDSSTAAGLARRALAGILLAFYCSLLVALALIELAPDATFSIVQKLIHLALANRADPSKVEIAILMAGSNIALLGEEWDLAYILFYGSSALLYALFLRPDLLSRLAALRSGGALPLLFLANNLTMSWALFPLEFKPMVWDEALAAAPSVAETIKPTDRLYRVELKSPDERTLEHYRTKYVDGPFGPKRYRLGYRHSPALDLSAVKSLSQINVAQFELSLSQNDGHQKITDVRQLSTGPLMSAPLHRVAAVTHFYSDRPLPKRDYLEPLIERPDFFLYRYRDAWPYFYLANGVQTISGYADLADKSFGPAYLFNDDAAGLPPDVGKDPNASVQLLRYGYDHFKFRYQSSTPALLVVADAWHPHWKAELNGTAFPIIKANGVFKAVLLPAGEGEISFHFENDQYQLGIWISLASALMLGLGWLLSWRMRRLEEGVTS